MNKPAHCTMKRTIKIGEGQCLIDVAMQYCGNAYRVFDIAALNGVENITDVLDAGIVLIVPETYIEDRRVADYFAGGGHMPASVEGLETELLDGIDYWMIEEEFTVQ